MFIDYIYDFVLQEKTQVSLSDNVKVASWLPQNDILGHSSTRLFINHGGVHGVMEAVFHGVPMICAPFFGDQYGKAHEAKAKGFAEIVVLDTITVDQLVDVIGRVLANQR